MHKSLHIIWIIRKKVVTLPSVTKTTIIMTALQMNAEVFRLMSVIAEDEALMARALKYLKGLVAKHDDPTHFTKEQFEERLKRAHEDMREGRTVRMRPGETMDELLRRNGYAI